MVRRPVRKTASSKSKASPPLETLRLNGIPASTGVAMGPALVIDSRSIAVTKKSLKASEIPREVVRFDDSLTLTRRQILDIQAEISKELGSEHGEIFTAHLMVLEDRALIEEVVTRLKKEKVSVEWIFSELMKKYVRTFSSVKDEYMRERTADIEDVGRRILQNLTGEKQIPLAELSRDTVVVAYDLSPSETASMHRRHVVAFVTDVGGRTSHTAIMAKSLEIPAVVGLEGASRQIRTGDMVIVDGSQGVVIVNPDPETIETYEVLRQKLKTIDQALLKVKSLPAETPDGRKVSLMANIELPEEVPSVIAHGAEGIGLYRTEFFYLNRDDLPTEEEQFEAYRHVAKAIAPYPVIIRTIDLGGDKFISKLKVPTEMNPFLGWRGIRFSLGQPDLFKVQLRAILRASAFGKIKLMFQMISGVDELRQCNHLLGEVRGELKLAGKEFDPDIEVGAMIEVPSAALTVDLLAKEVQFFSIGTNDLIQYALAVDRVNEKIAYLYEPAHPGVLRLIREVIEVAHGQKLWVGMCGEMAGEPALALILLGLGLDSFSTSAFQVPRIKQVIRSVPTFLAKEVVKEALRMPTGRDVEAFAKSRLHQLIPELGA